MGARPDEPGPHRAAAAIDLAAKQVRVLASGLHYAFGVAATAQGPLVSESWRHRLVSVGANGAGRALLDDLPVYPSRLTPARAGVLAHRLHRRTQLVEFVLRENAYRRG